MKSCHSDNGKTKLSLRRRKTFFFNINSSIGTKDPTTIRFEWIITTINCEMKIKFRLSYRKNCLHLFRWGVKKEFRLAVATECLWHEFPLPLPTMDIYVFSCEHYESFPLFTATATVMHQLVITNCKLWLNGKSLVSLCNSWIWYARVIHSPFCFRFTFRPCSFLVLASLASIEIYVLHSQFSLFLYFYVEGWHTSGWEELVLWEKVEGSKEAGTGASEKARFFHFVGFKWFKLALLRFGWDGTAIQLRGSKTFRIKI